MHEGYPTLLPLAFGIIKENTEEFKEVLELLSNPHKLWSNSGIRSLGMTDYMFRSGNNYWTNPVWINMNYLILRGLKLHYYHNPKAFDIYNKLRETVIANVCGNWETNGYFYENYNKYQNN
jgi:mannosyl-oligosaccharide glucosidase